VLLSPFEIDIYPVTNENFLLFADRTGYQTEAEMFNTPDSSASNIGFRCARISVYFLMKLRQGNYMGAIENALEQISTFLSRPLNKLPRSDE
jgi:hypothetical protein